MSDTITIRLPGEPKGKGRPRLGRHGVYTPPETVKYETSLAWVAKQAMNGRPPLEGPLSVLIVSAFPIPKSYSKGKRLDAQTGALYPLKRPDIDNIMKMIDGLNGIVWLDDCQIVRADVRKIFSAEPELAIQVTPL